MGFNIKKAREALKAAGGDVRRAVDKLFSNSSAADASNTATEFAAHAGTSIPRTTTADDEALARQLQAEYDDQETPRPQSGYDSKRHDSGITDDETYARLLQAQYDGTATAGLASGGDTEENMPKRETGTNVHPGPAPSLQPKDVEESVRSIADAINGVKCLNCRKYIVKNEGHILAFSKYIQDSEDRLIAIPCQNCRNPHNDKRARVYMIWALLCDFDTNSKHNKPDKRRRTKDPKRSAGNGTGYGTGYGGSYGGFAPWQQATGKKLGSAQPSVQPVQPSDADDIMTTRTINTLQALLPTFDREDEFELDERQLKALFLCSSLLERATELLRNNDLEEVTTQKALYDALARLLQTLAMHPSTSALVFGERAVRDSGASLLKISLGKASLTGGKEVDTVQPLSQYLQEFTVQCSMMLSHSTDATERQLFQAFIDLRDFLQANGSTAKKDVKQDKNAWHKEYAVSEVPDEYILPNHCLAAKSQASTQLLPGRMKRIMQEISRLQTSLPAGIFVRYGSSRPDVMKVVIIGPQGTPYENGLFEFDLICGNDFPSGPPKMQLRTTGNGAVRFNPNLYNCGKVCLSLLGTWEGEKWDPKQSTLLQVFLSIQAMIFCDLPWFNEPGRGNSNATNQQSMAYNKSLQPQTVQHAMLSWLEPRYKASQTQPGYLQSNTAAGGADERDIWSAIVEKHFHGNEDEIRSTISKWIAEVGGAPTGDLMQYLRAAVPKLRKAAPSGGMHQWF